MIVARAVRYCGEGDAGGGNFSGGWGGGGGLITQKKP